MKAVPTKTPAPTESSYSALLALPSAFRLLAAIAIARTAGAMLGVATVLFTLERYQSPALTGIVTFFSLFPGVVASPIAGALLDRHGRIKLVVLDYALAVVSLIAIGVLAFMNFLPVWLLIVIVTIAALTTPLSGPGLRSLFPVMVPQHLWERMNAVDSSCFVFATIVGPPLAAMLVAYAGGPMAMIGVGMMFGLAAIITAGIPEPASLPGSKGPVLRSAWEGLRYTLTHPTLRGLGVSLSVLNLGVGTMQIVVPLIVLNRLHQSEVTAGLMFTIQGIAGMVTAILFGRRDTRNRERAMIMIPMAGMGIATALLLLRTDLVMLAIAMAVIGLLAGPLDIGLFTLRQRRTDPAWTGRAFTISMFLNFLGMPVGSAIAGAIAGHSIEAAIAFAASTALAGALIAKSMIPVEG